MAGAALEACCLFDVVAEIPVLRIFSYGGASKLDIAFIALLAPLGVDLIIHLVLGRILRDSPPVLKRALLLGDDDAYAASCAMASFITMETFMLNGFTVRT